VLLEIDPATGRLAYSEFGLMVPRQSGKSTLLLAKAVHRALAPGFFGKHQRIIYTAQTRKDARRKFEIDYAVELAASRAFGQRVHYVRGNGDEHLQFVNGSRFEIEASTEKAGHGGTIDEAYIDEAFAQIDNRLEQAFRPAMITRTNKQLGWVSTAGWLDGSPFLQAKSRRGREVALAGVREGMAYFEWSAPDDADPEDRSLWPTYMPALGHTITEQAIAAELLSMDRNGFRRAYMNQWVPKSTEEAPSIGGDLWATGRDDASCFEGQPSLAVDVTMDRQISFVSMAGTRPDGKMHLQVLAQLPGTEHVVAEIAALRSSRPSVSVTLDPASAAGALIPDLQRAGVPLVLVTGTEVASACGAFYDGFLQGRVRYVEHEALTAAVANAVLRASARGASRWYPIGDGPSVSPLYSVTLAAHGLATATTSSSNGGWAVAL
jgi:phage terminase large subunit-like protein